MKKQTLKFFAIIIIIFSYSFANAGIIDSLKNVAFDKNNHDTIKINALIGIGWQFYNLDSSNYYANIALSLSEKNKYNKGIGKSLRLIGLNYKDLGNQDTALIVFKRALKYTEIAKDYSEKAKTYNNIGVLFKSLGDYDKTFAYYDTSYSINKQIKDTIELGNICNNIGVVYRDIGNYKKALEYQFQGLSYRESINNYGGIAQSFNNIGNIYYYMEDYNKAIEYYKKSLKIKIKIGNKSKICYAYNNLGSAFTSLKKNDSAFYYYKKNYILSKEIKNKKRIAIACREISELLIKTNKLDSAYTYLVEGYNAATELNNVAYIIQLKTRFAMYYNATGEYNLAYKYSSEALEIALGMNNVEEIKNSSFENYKAAKKLRKNSKALKSYETFIIMRDSIQNDKNYKNTLSQEFEYKEDKIKLEQEKKDAISKEEVKRQKIIRNSFFIGFLLMVLLVLVVLRSFLQKRKANQILSYQKREIEEKNEELNQQKEEIQAQSEELLVTNKELEKLSIVASETDNAIVIMDSEGNFEWINDGFTKLYGYNFYEFTQKHTNMLSASSNPEITQTIQKCIDSGTPTIYESVTEAKTGEKIWVQTTLTPILDEMGKVKKIIAIDSDIRKLKEIEKELELKNEHITGSIKYAKTIQTGILPFKQRIDKHFENFILFRPKDIVSGDFYWYVEKSFNDESLMFNNQIEQENSKLKTKNSKLKTYHFIAAVDCTGHGVPGAFMSMIGSSLLNQIVYNDNEYNTAKILTKLNELIIFSLRQDQTDNNDGMDVCLCRIEKQETSANVQFTGAKRPLLYIKNGESKIETIKGDRKSIGGTQRKRNVVDFSAQELSLDKNSIIYLSSDGFIDQNNPERKKYGTAQLISKLENIYQNSLETQHQLLNTEIENWMQNTQQRDDITIIGLKI